MLPLNVIFRWDKNMLLFINILSAVWNGHYMQGGPKDFTVFESL